MPSCGEIETRCLALCENVWYPFVVSRGPDGIRLACRRGVRAVVTLDMGQKGVLSFTTEHDQSPRQRQFVGLDQLEQLLLGLRDEGSPS